MSHVPVLLNKVIDLLDPKPGEFMIDGTLDGGGYAQAILGRLKGKGKFLGIDWDWTMIQKVHEKISAYEKAGVKISLINGNFADVPEFLAQEVLGKADGLVLDLGFSSEQLENSGRGFSFTKNEPLIMTYSDELTPVKAILKKLSAEELTSIIASLSQERFASRIAEAIKNQERKKAIETTGELTKIITHAVPRNYERGRLNPATRTFLALRIYANRELENLEKTLKNLNSILKSGGRAVIVSFHSLEDRLVKNYFRELSKVGELKILTKKPIMAAREEIAVNPKARSAKLRAAVLLQNYE